MTTDLTLNGVTLSAAVPAAIVLDVRRPLLAARRHVDVAVPGRAGAWRFDEEAGDRTVTIDVDIAADTFAARRAAVVALADWLDVGTTSNLVVDDEPDRYYDAIIESTSSELERLLAASATLNFAVGPYAKSSALTTSTVALAGSSPQSGTITITDDVYAEPIIEITPNNGTITGWTLAVGEYSLTWSSSTAIASGETLTVSSITDTITRGPNDDVNLTGAIDPLSVDMLDASGTWPLLITGGNAYTFTWTGTATDITLDLTWRERYR